LAISPQDVALRDYAEQSGFNVGWTPEQGVSINNVNVKPEDYNIQNVGGTYMGQQAQVDNLLKNTLSKQYGAGDFSQYLSQGGYQQPQGLDLSQYGLKDYYGKQYGTPEQYQQVVQQAGIQQQQVPQVTQPTVQPPVQQPQQATSTFRDYATSKGAAIDWTPETGATINGQPVDLAAYGMGLQDGHFVGTQDQYENVLRDHGIRPSMLQAAQTGKTGVREALEAEGFHVGYNAETGEVLVNGTPINPEQYGFELTSDNRYVADPATLQGIVDKFQDPMKFKDPYAAQKQAVLSEMEGFGAFQDPYEAQKQAILSQMQGYQAYQPDPRVSDYIGQLMAKSTEEFTYDPSKDESLQLAQKEVSRAIREEMGKRGMLYSDATVSLMAQEMGKLVPQFEAMSYQKWSDAFNRMLNMGQTMMQWDQMQSQYHMQGFDILQGQAGYVTTLSDQARASHMDAFQMIQAKADYISQLSQQEFEVFRNLREQMQNEKSMAIEQERFEYQKQQDQIQNAYQRIDYIGYVDNEASKMTGIPVGTTAGWALELLTQHGYELEVMDKDLEQRMKQLDAQTESEEYLFGIKSKWEASESAKDREFDREMLATENEYTAARDERLHGYDVALKNMEEAKAVATASNPTPRYSSSAVNALVKFYTDAAKANNALQGPTWSGAPLGSAAADRLKMAEDLISMAREGRYHPQVIEEARLKLGITDSILDQATERLNKMASTAGVAKEGSIVSTGLALTGTPYKWGGQTPHKGMDCSGFAQYVMGQNGLNIPRTTYDQIKRGTKVSKPDLQQGDLVFFDTNGTNGNSADHVGIYIGNGQMVHASSSKGVTTSSINSDYWKSRYYSARRY